MKNQSSMNQLLVKQHSQDKVAIALIVKDLHDLTVSINHKTLSQTLSDIRSRIDDPFMFVVVGEVKAGKSSFINALLDSDICGVAPQPFTDTIQQISFGETAEIVEVNEYFKKIKAPIEILKDIAIVDTPGTNAIIEHHQEITERFIPSSDLIVFVFEAKNPYRQSSWSFFDFIQEEWRKKIIFVLQQKDLLSDADLEINKQGVVDFAIKKGIEAPTVFAVSAKQEIEGDHELSGFGIVRDFIKRKVTGGGAAKLKLASNVSLAQNITVKLYEAIQVRKKQYISDHDFREQIKTSLKEQENKSLDQVSRMVSNILAGYDQVCYKAESSIRKELGFIPMMKRSFGSMFKKEKSVKVWINQLEERFSDDMTIVLQQKLSAGIFDVAESVNQMMVVIDSRIKQSETILKDDEEFFNDFTTKRMSILTELKDTFKNFKEDSQNFMGESIFGDGSDITPNVAKGGGIAVIGIILSTVTNIMVIDITGGILSAVGLIFAGVSLGLNKSKVMKGFKKETLIGREKLNIEISKKLNAYIEELGVNIDSNFSSFDGMLANEKLTLDELESNISSIENRLNALSTGS